MHTPKIGNSCPSSLTVCKAMPESSGLPAKHCLILLLHRRYQSQICKFYHQNAKPCDSMWCSKKWHSALPVLHDHLVAVVMHQGRHPSELLLSRPGPGESKIPLGLSARSSSIVFSSFLNTTCSQPKSPKYCSKTDCIHHHAVEIVV